MDDNNIKQPSVDHYQSIVDRAHNEIEGVRSVYKWLASILTIIISVAIFSVSFFTYKSMSDLRTDVREFRKEMKDDSRAELNIIKERTSQDVALLANKLSQDIEKVVHQVGLKVNSRIEEEFTKDNINLLVQKKTEERIDKVADRLIETKINQITNPKIDAVGQAAADLNNKYLSASNKVDRLISDVNILSERNRLTKLADDAISNGNRKALSEIRDYIINPSYPELRDAADAEDSRIGGVYVGKRLFEENSKTMQLNKDMTTSVLISYLESNSDWKVRRKAASLLRDRKEKGVPESLLAAFEDDNLNVVSEAFRSFMQITDCQVAFFDWEIPKKCWEQRKQDIYKRLKDQDSTK